MDKNNKSVMISFRLTPEEVKLAEQKMNLTEVSPNYSVAQFCRDLVIADLDNFRKRNK